MRFCKRNKFGHVAQFLYERFILLRFVVDSFVNVGRIHATFQRGKAFTL